MCSCSISVIHEDVYAIYVTLEDVYAIYVKSHSQISLHRMEGICSRNILEIRIGGLRFIVLERQKQ